jgi:hypothetical protein
MVTLVHQHGVESVATPQPFGFPQSGQTLALDVSMAGINSPPNGNLRQRR